MIWYFPSWNGDHRLLWDPKKSVTILEISNPALIEVEPLRRFLKYALKKGWTADVGFELTGLTMRELKTDLDTAGTALMKALRPRKGRITAIRFDYGKVHVETETEAKVLEVASTAVATVPSGSPYREPAEPVAAVTTKRGTMCCPETVPTNVRASECLEAFLDEQQLADWRKTKGFIAVGGLTGVAYHLAHRGSRAALKRKFIGWSIDDQDVLHYYDWSVPAEEELLGLKLCLEHREDWVRNPSGLFKATAAPVYHNPLGDDFMDGTQESALLRAFGEVLLMPGLTRGAIGTYPRLVGIRCLNCEKEIGLGEQCYCEDGVHRMLPDGRLKRMPS